MVPYRRMKIRLCLFGALIAIGCGAEPPATPPPADTPTMPTVARAPFGKTSDGHDVEVFTLENTGGLEVRVLTYGGIIASIKTPDRNGAMADIVLGFDTMDGYLGDHPYFGAVIGRYANRIAQGRFAIDKNEYRLAANNGRHHLHGGVKGFDKHLWTPEIIGSNAIRLSRVSPEGEEGYPGTLQVAVVYSLTNYNELIVEYQANTDLPTHVNLTQHSYFNLAGAGRGDVLAHELMIAADQYTPVDTTLIPTGQLASVAGTPFDFRTPAKIGARIGAAHPQIQIGGGYDHNWVLNRKGDALQLAARVVEPTSGRVLDVATTEPGMQLYTGNFLDGAIAGKGGLAYVKHGGFCLETQHYPDTPNQPDFPTTLLRPGTTYSTRTVFKFDVRK
jgi:aldose 1-epimerase